MASMFNYEMVMLTRKRFNANISYCLTEANMLSNVFSFTSNTAWCPSWCPLSFVSSIADQSRSHDLSDSLSFTTCNTTVWHDCSIWASHSKMYIRGKWPPCEYGLFSIKLLISFNWPWLTLGMITNLMWTLWKTHLHSVNILIKHNGRGVT